MSCLLRAELTKLWVTPTAWWLLTAAVAVSAVGTVATLVATTVHTGAEVRSLFSFAGAGGLVVLVAGVVGAGGEYRHRTIVPAALITPRRGYILAAQTTAYLLAGAVAGVACAALTTAIAVPWLTLAGTGLHLPASTIIAGLLGGVAYAALSAALGVSIGHLARNQVAAVVAVLVLVAIIDPTLSALVHGYDKYGLSGLGSAMSGDPGGTNTDPFTHLLPAARATGVYLAYAAVFLAAATLVTSRRELR